MNILLSKLHATGNNQVMVPEYDDMPSMQPWLGSASTVAPHANQYHFAGQDDYYNDDQQHGGYNDYQQQGGMPGAPQLFHYPNFNPPGHGNHTSPKPLPPAVSSGMNEAAIRASATSSASRASDSILGASLRLFSDEFCQCVFLIYVCHCNPAFY
jgi:hypothetical protein